MTTTHTPGPWTFTGGFIGTAGDDPQTVAYLSDHRNARLRSPLEAAANARLLAAAPELLDALRDVLDAYAPHDSELTREARQAIAKATGQPT